MKEFTLYYINGCPGARAVRLFIRLRNIKCNEILIDLSKGDHKTEQFLKLNPMHTVPTLVITEDNNIVNVLFESRLILKYLDGLYGQPIVPVFDLDKWLFWDLGYLNPNIGKIIYPRLFQNSTPNENDIGPLKEKFDYLEKELEGKKFLVGDKITISDLSTSMLIHNSQFEKSIINVDNYKNITHWLSQVEGCFNAKDWNDVMSPFFTYLFTNQV